MANETGGRIEWELAADSSQFNAAMASADAKAAATGASINNALSGASNSTRQALVGLADSMQTVGRNMTLYVSAPIAAAFGLSIKSASDFQDTLSQLRIISGASASELQRLSETAQALGKDVNLAGVTAADAADAMVELSKAGLSVNDTIGASRAVLTLAKAGQMDFADAATFTAAAMNAFKISGDKAISVADTLANGANASQASLHDLALGMQQSSSVAQLFGLSLQDNITALSIFANNGIRASDAGTSLKSMLLSIATPSKQAAEQMQKMGFNAYDAQGRFEDLGTISQRLQNSLKGMTDQQKQTALGIIFGSDAIRSASLLAANAGDNWDEMSKKIARTGTAADVAAAQYGPFKKALEGLKNNVSQLGLDIGNILMPPLTALFKSLTAGIQWFNELNVNIKKVVIGVGLLVAAIGPLIFTLATVGKTILLVQKALVLARFALVSMGVAAEVAGGALALTPVGWAIIAVAAFIAVLVVLQTKFQVITKTLKLMKPAWDVMVGALKETWNTIKTALTPAFQELKKALAPIQPYLKYIAIAVGLLAFGPIVAALAAFTAGMWVWGKIMHLLQPLIKWLFEWLGKLIIVYINIEKAIYQHTIGPLIDLAKKFDVVGKAVEGFHKVMRGITALFDDPIAAIKRFAGDVEYYFGRLIANAPGWGADLVKAIWSGIKALASDAAKIGETIFNWIKDGFMSVVGGAYNWAKDIVGKIWDGIKGIPGDLKSVGETIFNGIKDGFSALVRNAPQWGKDVVEAIKNGIKAIVKYDIDSIIDWKNGIVNAWQNAQEFVKSIGKGISDSWKDAKEWGKTTIKNIGDGITEAYKDAKEWGKNLIKQIGDGISEAFNDIVQWGKDLPGKIKDGIVNGYNDLKEGGKNIISGIIDGLKEGLGNIVQWFKDLPSNLKNEAFKSGAESGGHTGKGFMDYWSNQSNLAKIGQKILLGIGIAILAIPAALLLLGITLAVAIINGIVAGLQFAWSAAGGALEWLAGLGARVLLAVGSAIGWLWQTGVDLIQGLINGILSMGQALWNGISTVFSNVWNFFTGVLSWLWQTGVDLIQGLINGIISMGKAVWNAVSTVASNIGNFFAGAAGWLWGVGVAIITGLVNGIKSMAGAVWNGIKYVADQIGRFFSGAGHWLWDAGSAIIDGLVNGIKSGFNKVKDTLGDLTKKITSWKGPMAVDKVLLKPNAAAIMGGLVSGLEAGYGDVKKSLQGFTNSLGSTIDLGVNPQGLQPISGIQGNGGRINNSSPTVIENHIGTITIANDVDAENWLQRLTRQDEVTSTGLTSNV